MNFYETALSENKIYYLSWNKVIQTEYNNYFDYYGNGFQITYKSINFIKDFMHIYENDDIIDKKYLGKIILENGDITHEPC